MIFELGKTYKHKTGETMKIIGTLETHIYGWTLVGENSYGKLIPVGHDHTSTVNWMETEKTTEE